MIERRKFKPALSTCNAKTLVTSEARQGCLFFWVAFFVKIRVDSWFLFVAFGDSPVAPADMRGLVVTGGRGGSVAVEDLCGLDAETFEQR